MHPVHPNWVRYYATKSPLYRPVPQEYIETRVSTRFRVLFLCVHNSARSQMAEGLLRAIAGDRFDVFSAGSVPTSVNPFAVRVLRDEGIDISQQESKSVAEFVNQRFDYVITLCAEEECPIFPGSATRLHWDLPDPAAMDGDTDEKWDAFCRVAGEIKKRLDVFVATDIENNESSNCRRRSDSPRDPGIQSNSRRI